MTEEDNVIYLNNFNERELEDFILSLGMEKYRKDQIFRAMHKDYVDSIDKLNQISKKDRELLKKYSSIKNIEILRQFESKIDETKKFLYLLYDKNIIEGVLMKYKYGYTLCVSTQVGCRMGCSFCASTKGGLSRNLDVSEIISQVYIVEKELGINISNIVFMGSGEPFDNYDNLMKSIEILNDPNGKNLSRRNITVSTCGIAEKIIQFGKDNDQSKLAVSVHSFDDAIRTEMMPINRKYGIENLMKSIREYQKITNNRISIEYTVVSGKNDSEKDVKLMNKYLSGLNYVVNIIAINPISEYNKINSDKDMIAFQQKLKLGGINFTVRRELGRDISASCGQLKIHFLEEGSCYEI